MCTLECPRRRGFITGQVKMTLAAGRNPRGLHPDSYLLREATATMVRAEAMEREEMDSIVTQLNELKAHPPISADTSRTLAPVAGGTT